MIRSLQSILHQFFILSFSRRSEDRVSPLVNWGTLEKYYPNYPDIDDLTLTSEDREAWLDLRPYMERGPHILYSNTSLQRGYKIFRTLGLRHLFIIDHSNHIIGIVTRTELLPEHISRYEERSPYFQDRGIGGSNRNSPKSRPSALHENGLEMMERGGGYSSDQVTEDESVEHLKRRVTLDGLVLEEPS